MDASDHEIAWVIRLSRNYALLEMNPRDRVWQVIRKASICMMVTRFSAGMRARPLEARLLPQHEKLRVTPFDVWKNLRGLVYLPEWSLPRTPEDPQSSM